ncbi:hypothetical protein QQ045_032808 [Rhodiola kirilowii]
MTCVTTVQFSVLLNGNLEGYFGSNRGLRHSDPISPYIFTLVMEVLGRLLGSMRMAEDFNYHPKCARVNLSHLMFADDVIIFSKAAQTSLLMIKDVLETFYRFLGLKINSKKSSVYFGDCSDGDSRFMADLVGFQLAKPQFIYLGIPVDGRALRRVAYNVLIDKMTSKINSWSARCLSYSGRLVLVKHVLGMINSYWMRVLSFPKSVFRKITSICRSYLWAGSSYSKRSLLAWKVVCLPKSNGGLGLVVKNLMVFNKALLLRQVWDLCLKKETVD